GRLRYGVGERELAAGPRPLLKGAVAEAAAEGAVVEQGGPALAVDVRRVRIDRVQFRIVGEGLADRGESAGGQLVARLQPTDDLARGPLQPLAERTGHSTRGR